MADPVSALATASTVSGLLQIIDFSAKVLHEATQLMRDDVPREAISLARLGKQHADVSEEISKAVEGRPQPLTALEQNMDDLAKDCRDESGKLVDMMNDLRLDGVMGPKRAVRAVRTAVRATWKKKDMEDQKQRLQHLNSLLGTAMLEFLRGTLTANHEELKDHMKQNADEMKDQLKRDKDELKEKMQQDTASVLLAVQAAVSEIVDGVARQREKSTKIAASLRFRDMVQRRDEIPPTYGQTYEWIFDSAVSPFRTWLEQGDDVFWVSGLAGSGKSTLMKLISQHEQTKKLAQMWAGADCHVVLADFYFWFLGSKMQKSVCGLLRSMLYQIFNTCPELVRTVCPKRWKHYDKDLLDLDPWTEEELHRALRITATEGCRTCVGEASDRREVDVRYIFFIDGLDEYDGNHRELVNLINEMGKSKYMKLCVSSRPWNAFINAFEPNPSFRLEDLTRADIATYVRGELTKAEKTSRTHRLFSTSAKPQTEILIKTVIDKAHGVFFWVFLVVRSLCDGFSDGDSIKILQQRVDGFPDELLDYFSLMLKRLDGVYRKLTAQLLYLAAVPHYNSDGPLSELSFIDLWPLLEQPEYFENASFAFNDNFEDCSTDDLKEMLLQVSWRVRAWCRDFLHIPSATTVYGQCDWPADVIARGSVQFLHRTVYDFLKLENVQASLRGFTPAHFYEPGFAAKVALARLKSLPSGLEGQACQQFSSLSLPILHFASSKCEDDERKEVLSELDGTAVYYMQHHCSQHCVLHDRWDNDEDAYSPAALILVRQGLCDSATEFLNREANNATEQSTGLATSKSKAEIRSGKLKLAFAIDVLRVALGGTEGHGSEHGFLDTGLIRAALEAGADPNASAWSLETRMWSEANIDHATMCSTSQRTMWTSLLQRCMAATSNAEQREQLVEVATLLLEYGADTNVRCMQHDVESHKEPRANDNYPTKSTKNEARTLKVLQVLESVASEDGHDEIRSLVRKCSSISWQAQVMERRERLEG